MPRYLIYISQTIFNNMAEKDELNLAKYPKEFQKFLEKEMEIVKSFVRDGSKVLDVAGI